MCAFLVACLTLSASNYFRANVNPTNLLLVYFASIGAGFVTYAMLKNFNSLKVGIAILLVCEIVTSAPINPIVLGTNAYYGNTLTSKIISINKDQDVWVANSMSLDAYLMVAGTNHLSGQQMLGPKNEAWKILDPSHQYIEEWNRAASFVVFSFEPNIKQTKIETRNTDVILVHVNPCDPALKKLKIKYLLSEVDLGQVSCLTLLYKATNPVQGWIYDRI
jgi:hypothetical protein